MDPSNSKYPGPGPGDALVVVDVQNDFLPGGSLGVPDGDKIIPVINRYIDLFKSKRLPIFATRDWHPDGHCSFKDQGGPWPVHCIAGSKGAGFPPGMHLPDYAVVISKATAVNKDAYSGFEGTDLDSRLRSAGIRRLMIGGLATDYCVLNTVKGAIKNGYGVLLLTDAMKAVNVMPGDGERALTEMMHLGGSPVEFGNLV